MLQLAPHLVAKEGVASDGELLAAEVGLLERGGAQPLLQRRERVVQLLHEHGGRQALADGAERDEHAAPHGHLRVEAQAPREVVQRAAHWPAARVGRRAAEEGGECLQQHLEQEAILAEQPEVVGRVVVAPHERVEEERRHLAQGARRRHGPRAQARRAPSARLAHGPHDGGAARKRRGGAGRGRARSGGRASRGGARGGRCAELSRHRVHDLQRLHSHLQRLRVSVKLGTEEGRQLARAAHGERHECGAALCGKAGELVGVRQVEECAAEGGRHRVELGRVG
mmetsp:Transcript_19679/g.58612  ORF Transcript_19679/g.58612 Transcript_19679/m.58612 type:complete len:283 (-) Transcript_19679:201-1049(-)